MTTAATFDDPKVRDLWDQWKPFVHWFAKRLSRTFGGRPRDYLGTLTLKFAESAAAYDPGAGAKFNTFYGRFIYSYVCSHFLQYESERRHLWYCQSRSTSQARQQRRVEYAFHEANDYYLYRVPDDEADSIAGVVDAFDTAKECWDFFCRGLDHRRRLVLELRYKHDWTLEEVGNALGVTKERARQLEADGLRRVRERLALVQRFTGLFQKRMDEV